MSYNLFAGNVRLANEDAIEFVFAMLDQFSGLVGNYSRLRIVQDHELGDHEIDHDPMDQVIADQFYDFEQDFWDYD